MCPSRESFDFIGLQRETTVCFSFIIPVLLMDLLKYTSLDLECICVHCGEMRVSWM